MIQPDGAANGTIKTVKHANEALHTIDFKISHTNLTLFGLGILM